MSSKILSLFSNIEKREEIASFVFSYLKKFGYINNDSPLSDIVKGIIAFRKMASLMEGDTIDDKLIKAMTAPRCLLPDNEHFEEANALPKWGLKKVTYALNGYDSDVTEQEWGATFEKAFSQITDVCGIAFERVNGPSNIIISLGSGAADQFDGPSGVLAWCELPSTTSYTGRIQSKFDKAETWVPFGRTGRGIYLLNVACHELLHGMGLSHTNVPGSLMNPFYDPNIEKPQSDDIMKLEMRYGKPKVNPIVPPTPIVPTPSIPSTPTSPTSIIITGKIDKIEIPGYRVQKIG